MATPFPPVRFAAAVCTNATRAHGPRVGWDTQGKRRCNTRRYVELEKRQLPARVHK
ncbi:hypothetical protein [Streptomyces sp. AM6-12]|uniref:hypothetical protein n=1 Tax=Streptomyces sp. AM6-12 TaxID=3345149 RepID=UPI00378DC916